MPSRLVWHDDYDHELVRTRLAAIRQGQCVGWDWFAFEDEPGEKSWLRLGTEVGISPAFGPPGKIVCCRGEPYCAADFAKVLSKWTSGKDRCPVGPDVMFLLISPPGGKLANAISAASESDVAEGLVKVFHVDRLTKDTAKAWVMQRSAVVGATMAEDAAKLMVDMVGTNPNVLTMEIRRLKHLSPDGRIMPWAVEQHCRRAAEAEAFALENAIMAGDHARAFSLGLRAGRLEEALRMMGGVAHFLCKQALVDESLSGDIERVMALLPGIKVKRSGGAIEQMFSAKALSYAKAKNRKAEGWALRAIPLLMKAQDDVRKNPDDYGRLMADMAFGMADQ